MPRALRSDGQSKPAKLARKRARKAGKARPRGRPSKFTSATARKILDQLATGVPLTIICSESGLPSDDTVRNWAAANPAFSRDIARALEARFDRIALAPLDIADAGENDTIAFEKNGQQVGFPDKEWILLSKLRVETRLKLLATWEPKRYGENITQEISGPDGGPVKTEGDFRPTAEDELVIRRIAETRAKLQAGQHSTDVIAARHWLNHHSRSPAAIPADLSCYCARSNSQTESMSGGYRRAVKSMRQGHNKSALPDGSRKNPAAEMRKNDLIIITNIRTAALVPNAEDFLAIHS